MSSNHNVDIWKMSAETGIGAGKIKEVLGIPSSGVYEASTSTIEKAKEDYCSAHDGSVAKIVAFEKWNKLSLEEARRASTVAEAREAHYNAPVGSKAERIALEKWIGLASTVEEAKEAYRKTPDGSGEERYAIRKLATFFPKEKALV